jgi:hypothetical protein
MNNAAAIKRFVDDDDHGDFEDRLAPLVLTQAMSSQVIVGDSRYVKGAQPGMFIGRLGDEQVVLTSLVCQPIIFLTSHPQFTPGQRTPVHDFGERLPPEAVFHYAHEGYPRSGHYLPNRDAVVPTITLLMLVDHDGRQYPGGLRFAHAAYPIGREFGIRAQRLKATIEGETARRSFFGKYQITAERETKNSRTYFVPKPTLLGVFGEPAGPTLEQVSFARDLRRACKAGDDWLALTEPPEPPALTKAEPASVVIEDAEANPPAHAEVPADLDHESKIPFRPRSKA